jgi:nucleoside-diphosphate-sugar epimerase
VRRFVQVSSVAVHAYTGHFEADPRTTPRTGRVGSYPRSKRMAEALVAAASIPEVVVVRPGLWPFGARDPNFMALVAPLQAGKLPLVAGGRSRLNTAYLENLAEGLFLAGTVPGAAGRTYVIADEGAPTWREALGHLAQLLGAPPPGPSVPGWLSRATGAVVEATWALARPGREPPLTAYRGGVMCHDVHFSIDAARHELGYAPAIDWREGLERTLAAFGRNR